MKKDDIYPNTKPGIFKCWTEHCHNGVDECPSWCEDCINAPEGEADNLAKSKWHKDEVQQS